MSKNTQITVRLGENSMSFSYPLAFIKEIKSDEKVGQTLRMVVNSFDKRCPYLCGHRLGKCPKV